ncbi:isochorismatase hydrolase [Flagelloscypha sp. PMI_526]|nr:isochorismatase hydrolase [Flagelloscypha sp. PMI_526]
MSSQINPPQCGLLVIDVQSGLDNDPYNFFGGPIFNLATVQRNIASLLDAFRRAEIPVIHVHHESRWEASPLHSSSPGHAPFDWSKPIEGETVFTKDVNSAFVGTALESTVRKLGIRRLIIIGLTTDHCVSSTTRMARDLDVSEQIWVVKDATGASAKGGFDGQTIHETQLASLEGEFATIVSTDDVIRVVSQD